LISLDWRCADETSVDATMALSTSWLESVGKPPDIDCGIEIEHTNVLVAMPGGQFTVVPAGSMPFMVSTLRIFF